MKPTKFLCFGLLLSAWGCGTLFAEGVKGRPIEFSGPPGGRDDQSANRLTPGQTRLGQLENELNQPFLGLTPGNSLDGLILSTPPPMPPPVVPSSRARELSKMQDWMFMQPEELLGLQNPEDKYKAPELTPDGRDRNGLRPLERAYLDVFGASKTTTNTNQAATPSANIYGAAGIRGLVPGPETAASVPGLLNATEEGLGRALGWDTGFGGSPNPDAADFFKFNNGYKAPTKPSTAELQRIEEFKRIYDFSDNQLETAPHTTDHIFSSPYVDSSFFDPPKPTVPAPVATLGGGLGGSSLGAVATPSWAPAPNPAPETARSVTMPSSPFMNLPRRNF